MDPQPYDLVTCPYNPAHQVEQCRMHLHLNKCSRQNVKSGKTTCPFDVTHVVDEVELDCHVAKCPKRGMLDTQVYVTDNDHRPVVPVVQLPAPESSDDWENDAQTSFVPDPSKKPHVIQKIKGATASERKKARAQFTTQYKPLE